MDFRENLNYYVLSLIGRYLERAWREGWIRFDTNDVRAGWPNELRELFNSRSRSMLASSESLVETVMNWQGMNFTRFWGNIVEMACHGNKLADRWCELDEKMHFEPEEISMLAVLTAIEFDWSLLRALRFVMAEMNPGRPKWGFMVRFLVEEPYVERCSAVLHPKRSRLFLDDIVRLIGYALDGVATHDVSLYTPVASYLMGFQLKNDVFEESVDLDEFEPEIQKQITRTSKSAAPVRAVVEAAIGSGKRHVIRALAGCMGCSGIWPVNLMAATSLEDALNRISEARAMAAIHNAVLVVPDVSNWIDRWGDSTRLVIEKIESSGQPVAWLVTGDVPELLHIEPDAHIRMNMPNRVAREKIWRSLLGEEFSQQWITQLAGQFLLTRGQIESAVRAASSHHADNEEQAYNQIAAEARQISKEGLGSLATAEPARVTFEQLIVSDECRTALEDLLMYAKHRKELAKEWGFERSMPYGLGLAALFSGPPGTGKTYGAQVIATELQLELYRVDLSQLVSKYIGETEKHLAELFNVAEQGEVLLLFDEADSVFGKRTEVKNSVDRYANLEINYLLQRLERFTGVSILTSNFDSAIDEAFMRRIRFKVPFELPETKSRLILWKKFLSPAIPRAADVDLDVLADLFELSGGHIKEAVLRAASIAYGSKDKQVTQELLIRSAQLEYKKLGKLAPQINEFDEERYL